MKMKIEGLIMSALNMGKPRPAERSSSSKYEERKVEDSVIIEQQQFNQSRLHRNLSAIDSNQKSRGRNTHQHSRQHSRTVDQDVNWLSGRQNGESLNVSR